MQRVAEDLLSSNSQVEPLLAGMSTAADNALTVKWKNIAADRTGGEDRVDAVNARKEYAGEATAGSRMTAGVAKSVGPKEKRQLPAAIQLIFLVTPARSSARGSFRGNTGEITAPAADPNAWDLATKDGDQHIVLPAEIATKCYGTIEQKATIRLHCDPLLEREGFFEPQLEITPAPRNEDLVFTVAFPNGDQRDLIVPVPWNNSSIAWSQPCEPLPAAALGVGMQELTVKVTTKMPGN